MSAAAQSGLRLLRGGTRHRDGARRTSGRLLAALLVLGAVAATPPSSGAWARSGGRSGALPDEQRQALLSRTVEEMRELCGPTRRKGLEAHCQGLASFAAHFEECRGECLELVRRELAPQPPR